MLEAIKENPGNGVLPCGRRGYSAHEPDAAIKPGDNFEMEVSYILDPQGMAYIFNKSTVYGTTDLSII